MKKETIQNLALVLASILFALFLINLALVFAVPDPHDHQSGRIAEAKKQGIFFDERSKFDVLMDLRAQGKDAWPLDYPEQFLQNTPPVIPEAGSRPFFPLGSIAHALIVHCNENGTFTTFESDRYGFNNPNAVYDQTGDAVMLIGDSFAQGDCVPRESNVAGHLAKKGIRVINMGMGGSGPLVELAILKEYAKEIHPQKIFWLYYHYNDLTNLKNERAHPLLKRYLKEPNFTLDMRQRQKEVDRYWKERAQALIKVQQDKPGEVDSTSRWQEIFTFKPLRDRLRRLGRLLITFVPQANALLMGEETSALLDILKEAQRFSKEELKAEFYFIYIPSHMEFEHYPKDRDMLLDQVRALEIPVIDFRKTLEHQPDPLAYFPFKVIGHYTSEGYGLLSEQIYREGWNTATD